MDSASEHQPAAGAKLYAISDLHVGNRASRNLVERIAARPRDWLILAGDIGENIDQLEWTLQTLRRRFLQLIWVPGNHDLWTLPSNRGGPAGEHRYLEQVALCRQLGVLTPEDPYPTWVGMSRDAAAIVLAPLFLLYDYTFRSEGTTKETAIAEAYRAGVICTDEYLLRPDPYPSREAWCQARVKQTAERLSAIPEHQALVLISHFPLRQDLISLPHMPQFVLWCGTRLTEDWHIRYHATVVVYGHLHLPRTSYRDGVRFEEVSIGYQQEWMGRGCDSVPLRQVLPQP